MTGHPRREFIDTNVLVYAHDISAGIKHVRAREKSCGKLEAGV